MPRQLVLYIAKGGSDASSGSSWAPDDYTPVDVGLRSTSLFLFFYYVYDIIWAIESPQTR